MMSDLSHHTPEIGPRPSQESPQRSQPSVLATLASPQARAEGERGIAAVWVAMMLGLMMAFAAMAIDLGLWYVARSEVQNATDAAALAGAAMLPTDPVAAVAEAQRVAGQHGFDPTQVDAVVVGNGQLEVVINKEVDNFFLPALGFSDTSIVGASALAEYEGAVTMGTPNNLLGNQPEAAAGYVQPEIVLGVAGPGHVKQDGDRYSTKRCTWGSGYGTVTNCSGSSGPNQEFDENGYFFSVNVDALAGQDLLIEIYDPMYVDSGLACNYGNPRWFQRNELEDLTDNGSYNSGGLSIPHGFHDDAYNRYQWNRTKWCTGDSLGSGDVPDTTFIVRGPDNTPWNALDNPVMGVDIPAGNCQPTTFGGYDLDHYNNYGGSKPNGYELLSPTSAFSHWGEWSVDYSDDYWTFAESFRRWVPVCRIESSILQTGEYIVQVRTSASAASPLVYDSSKAERGVNFFMLQAGFDVGDPVWSHQEGAGGRISNFNGNVTISARGRLPIFANSDVSNPEFFLARILPVSQSRTLTVELFDAGDAGQAGTIQVIPPSDANLSVFSGCVFLRDGGGTISSNASTCKLSNVSGSSGYQGRTVLIDVPIPAGYDCNENDPQGCWVKLKMEYPSDVHDFTTWGATVSGDPVRLIE